MASVERLEKVELLALLLCSQPSVSNVFDQFRWVAVRSIDKRALIGARYKSTAPVACTTHRQSTRTQRNEARQILVFRANSPG